MIRSNTNNEFNNLMSRGTIATVAIVGAAVAGIVSVPAAAQAQASSSHRTSYSTPSAAQPVISRIATMWQAAAQRSNNSRLPAGSRTSYRAAASSLRQALTAAHVRPSSSAMSGDVANTPVSTYQLADDIRTLRSAGLNQVAIYYATGAKEFVTGSLRDALLSTPSARSIAITESTGMASSAEMPARRSGLNGYRRTGVNRSGGVLMPDGSLSAYSPNDALPSLEPVSGTDYSTPLSDDPYPFNTGYLDPVVVYPTTTTGVPGTPVTNVVNGTPVVGTPPVVNVGTPPPTAPVNTNP